MSESIEDNSTPRPGAADSVADDADPNGVSVSPTEFVNLLAAISRHFGKPFDAELVLRAFPPPHDIAIMVRALAGIGLDVQPIGAQLDRLDAAFVPCLTLVEQPGGPVRRTDGPTGRLAVHLLVDLSTERSRWLNSTTGKLETRTGDALAESPLRAIWRIREQQPVPQEPHDQAPRRGFGFRWFLPEILRHRRVWRDVILASLLIQLLGLSVPIFTQVIIDKVIVHHSLGTLTVIAVGLGMFMAFSMIMTWLRQYLVLHTGNRIDAVLGGRVFKHLMELPLRYFERRSTGNVIARVQGMETIRAFVTGAGVSLLLDVPFLIVFLTIMFYYSWQLSLFVMGVLLVIAILSVSITPALRRRIDEQFLRGAKTQAFVTEYVNGVETVKALQMEPRLTKDFENLLAAYLGAAFRAKQLSNTYQVGAQSLEQIQTLGVLCAGALTVMREPDFTVGMLVAFSMFASRLSQPVLRLVGLWQEFQQAAVAVRRLGDIMDAPREPQRLLPARSAEFLGKLEISDLSFRYSHRSYSVLESLNLRIPAGQCVAITGPSGSGKSSLVKLLLGFHSPDAGQIRIDDQDIRNLAANELRRYFGVVPQDTVLFRGTILDNLQAAAPGASFERVISSCRLAGIHEAVEQLPDGYQTLVGEHGVGLSGGQRQRLAIARALLTRPRILIFDEPISQLDHDSAEHIAQTVNRLRGKLSVLFISHQLPGTLVIDQHVRLSPPQTDGGTHPRSSAVLAGARGGTGG